MYYQENNSARAMHSHYYFLIIHSYALFNFYVTYSTGRYEGGCVDRLVSGCRYAGWNSNRPHCGKHLIKLIPHINSREFPWISSHLFEMTQYLWQGASEVGGLSRIWEISEEGGRLNLFK